MSYKNPDEQRSYQRQWVALRKAVWFADKFCVQCGSIDLLELDHIDPSQKVSHKIWSWSKERRDAEIAKCQVLCESCHLDKTIEHMRKEVCPKGHAYYPDNADLDSKGALKECKTCRRDRQRKARHSPVVQRQDT